MIGALRGFKQMLGYYPEWLVERLMEQTSALEKNVTAWQRQAFEHTCSTTKCNCGVGIATHRFDCPALDEAIERGD